MLGYALDRAVTAFVLNWKTILLFFFAYSANDALDNLWLRLSIDLFLIPAWTASAAGIALRSLGEEPELSARNIGRFLLTLAALDAVALPFIVAIGATWLSAAPLAIRFQLPWVTLAFFTTTVAVVIPISRVALAPLVSMRGGLSTREAFGEAIALTRGRYLYTTIVLCAGYFCAILPFYAMYNIVLGLFKVPELHLDLVPLVDQIWIASFVARPFGLYAGIASWVVLAQLVDRLKVDKPAAKAEGLV